MQIRKIYPKGFAANSYIVTEDGRTAIVVDPSSEGVEEALRKEGLTPVLVLLTHAHFDHVGGVPALQGMGARVACSSLEKPLVGTFTATLGMPYPDFSVDRALEDREKVAVGGLTITPIFTAGHTAGSACYLLENNSGERALFSGDTLFAGSIGNTAFPTGDMAKMRESLKKLDALFDDIAVFCGHGEDTSLEEERRGNPYFCDL